MGEMSGQVKPSPSPRGVFDAVVRSYRRLCDEHFLLRLDVGPKRSTSAATAASSHSARPANRPAMSFTGLG
jgi:hypothetical protein